MELRVPEELSPHGQAPAIGNLSRRCVRSSRVNEGVVEVGGALVMADFSVVAGGNGEEDDDARIDWGWLGTMDLAELKRVTRQMIPTFWCGSMLPPATCTAMVAVVALWCLPTGCT